MIRQIVHIWLVTHIMRLRGARMVWTAHDPEPHRSPINAALFHGWSGWLWRHYRRHMLKRVDGVLLMSESHRATVRANFSSDRNVPMAVVPHPHYRGQYLDTITRQDARGLHGIEGDTPVVAFIGALREYKNPDGLLNAFHQMSRDAVLLMAGSTESDHHSHLYEELAARDGRVKLTCGFVPDDELQDWFRAADLVILPYRKVTNSGSAHLALSFDLPVLVPDEPIFVELERLVGGDWVRRYSGELSGPIIEDALTWIRQPRPAAPDLSEIDWQTIAGRTLDFYKSVARPGRA
jgi:glycosyltransferase involved in cell wall biosynthesis